MNKKVNVLLMNVLAFGGLMAISACGDDDDPPPPDFDAPQISITSGAIETLKPGEAIEVDLSIDADGGVSSIIVNRNGGFLEEIDITDQSTTSYTYTGESVPADAIEGDNITYEFIAVNTQETESSPAAFMVDVAVYDLIGGSSAVGDVYEVIIPADGNVPDGTTVTFAEDRSYYVSGSLNFEDGSSFVIEPGVTIYLNADAEAPVFVEIQAAANLDISGTATSPVVMTSSRLIANETAEPGDWDTFELEGTANSNIQYLRIEYATEGFRVDDCDDSNLIEYVTVYRSADEGIYITGGNVNAKYLASVETGDSNFRLGDNYSGNLQFLIAYNDGDGGEAFYLREDSDITLSNVTVVGPGTDSGFGNSGVRFRSITGGKMYNAVVTGIPDWGVRAQEAVPTDIDGPVVFAYSHVYGNTSRDDDDGAIFFSESSFMNSEDPIEGISVGSIVPSAEAVSDFDPTSIGSFYSSASFKGAIQNAANDWTVGWVRNPDGSIR